ncbi:MAG: SUMF1/EgtB/PvdO family nonheme iron enzyme [Pseudomonadota bacterium]
MGWCDDPSNDRQNRAVPHKVGMKKANELGIYDMSGNVWQWCFDQGGATGRSRVTRGGSVSDDADYARVSYRGSNAPSDSFANVGVRVVWSPVP